ncbi:hypothetical protein CHLRE_16g671400v5 [Chlamydomonas reinhardtii]|uniref:Arylsulfatase n=1 Tax=Chlamydomonas reinhardtii TaxID=3055 RepID=A0A2K3CUG8_CHLRE|nr:uncharacterized protein CHLRE_16g671400v5 [Chlamydomonas reinhardtii]PNW71928.1 hypothetical protein CHLRE_16g671400v5 [Chlamydomonas reinhardtii]
MGALAVLAVACLAAVASVAHAADTKKPNFVVIFTDDQDAIQNSTHPHYMPSLHKYIRYPGVELSQYFVTTPVCCPSRTNLWRGQFAHNTNFTSVLPPYGGWAKWKGLGIDQSYLPLWLKDQGYNTYYVGKFLVDYSVSNYQQVPAGWDDIDALVTPYTFDYNTPGFSRNGATPNIYPGEYSTDVIRDKGVAQIKSAVAAGKPFYAQISPIAPHTSTQISTNPATGVTRSYFFPPIPAPRHWQLFSDANLPGGTPNKNLYEVDVSDKPAWIRALPLAQQNNRTYLEEIYRLRLRSLAAVDELIEQVVKTLDEAGVLDNTYIIYSADNGYHVGAHRFGAGKTTGYEEDLRVPFLIRGPGIKASKSDKPQNSKVGLHVDFAPTILSLAGASHLLGDKGLDGTPLGLYANDDGTLRSDYPRPEQHRQQFQGEFWGGWSDELLQNLRSQPNNTWKVVRTYDESSKQGWKLIAQCTNERELYDLRKDPGELYNIYDKAKPAVRSRLEGLLAVLAVCKGESCSNPWKILHPDGTVKNFTQALNSKYDRIYNAIRPFTYKRCLPYLDWDNEDSQFKTQIRGANPAAGVGHHRLLTAASERAIATRRRAQAAVSAELAERPAVFQAKVEEKSVPVPQDILKADVEKWFAFNNAEYYLA